MNASFELSERLILSYIVLNDAQANVVSQAKDSVAIRDRNGKHLGYLARGFTDADLRAARERAVSEGPRFTTSEMLNRLAAQGR